MKLLYNFHDLGDAVLEDSDSKLVKINDSLNDLELTSTRLHRGHVTELASSYTDLIYVFVQGSGMITVDNQKFRIGRGSMVLVPAHSLYQVINDGEMYLIFNCISSRVSATIEP